MPGHFLSKSQSQEMSWSNH